MYPFKISYSTKEQKEQHKDEIYGYANDLSEIKKIIYKSADEYICEYKNKIFREMEENDEISQNTFYKMYDYLPSVKYFDISPKCKGCQKEDSFIHHYSFMTFLGNPFLRTL
jgi:hypothetical protein